MEPSMAMANGRVWRRILLIACALVAATVTTVRGEEGPTPAKALAAWTKRQEGPKSLQYFCDMETSKMVGAPQGTSDAFAPQKADDDPKRAVLVRTKAMFALSGKKIAYTKDGDHLSMGALETAQSRRIYDGAKENSLFQRDGFSAGEVDSGSWAERMLLCNKELVPFFLAHQPIRVLEEIGYKLDRMTVSQAKVFRNGHECVEYAISRPSQALASRLWVDPARDYLPLEYADLIGERVASRMAIKYVSDPQVLWRISEIHVTSFARTGVPRTSWFFKMTDFSVNKTMDDIFTLDFPEGTQVVEGTNIMAPVPEEEKGRDSWKEYVVGPDGKQIPRTDAPRGATDGSARISSVRLVAVIAGAVLLVSLVSASIWRRSTKLPRS